MKKLSICIASRTLRAGEHQVIVTINKPEEDEGDFRCMYQVSIADQLIKEGYTMGVDAVQALQLAMVRINSELLSVAQRLGVGIVWLDHAEGYTGFV